MTGLDELVAGLPPGAVVVDRDVTAAYSADRVPGAGAGVPLAVVHAQNSAHVATVLRWASRHRVPVVARGAGSGLAAGANVMDGGIVLSLVGMSEIVELDPTDALAVVHPGVLTADLNAACAAVTELHGARLVPSMLEITDATTIRVVDDALHMGLDLDAAALLVAQSDAGPLAAGEVSMMASVCDVLIGTFGHAADGNLHPTIVYDDGSADRAAKAFDDILSLSLRLGGTLSGEHGVGRLNGDRLHDEVGAVSMSIHRAIKHELDPSGILNPGAVLS